MNRMKSLAMMAAMMAASADGNFGKVYKLHDDKPRLYCGNCEHCPKGNKTYCKTAKHHTTRATNCTNCRYYKET